MKNVKFSHKGTWIAYADCKCKYCKKARIGTRKMMSDIEKVFNKTGEM